MAKRIEAVAAEDIYDALLDDESLAALPQRLAEAYGARSSLIHWVYADGTADILAHSRYFSDEQLATYAVHFAAQDPWIEASARAQKANIVMDLEELVPVGTFTRTSFYNDYVREMGDDTCRCMGLRIENGFGSGFVALQRGRSQPGFDRENVSAMQSSAPHLRRMLSLRGRLGTLQRQQAGTAAMLDALGQAAILLTSNGGIIHLNAAAGQLLNSSAGLVAKGNLLCATSPSIDGRLKSAIARASAQAGMEATALNISRPCGGQLALSLAPILLEGSRHVLILARDDRWKDASLERRLRDLYRLSGTEARLAVMLAHGANLAAIAEERGVALGTIRTQVKAIMAKLSCGRQADIVSLVKNLPPLW